MQLNTYLDILLELLILFFCLKEEKVSYSSFCGANYACDKVERKSTSRSCHFTGGNFVTWIYKKQGSTALSVTPSTPHIYVLIIKEVRNQN